MKHVPKHKRILRQCGLYMATLYLKKRGYSVEECVTLLLRG